DLLLDPLCVTSYSRGERRNRIGIQLDVVNTRASGDPRRNLDGRQPLDALDGAARGLDSLQQICRGSVRRLHPLTAARASRRQTLDGDQHECRLPRERADQVEVLE